MNRYDLEHVCTAHGRIQHEDWQAAYLRAWLQYYSIEHIETLLRRAIADGIATKRLMLSLVAFRAMPLIEHVHPLQGGYLRRKSADRAGPDHHQTIRCCSMSDTGRTRSRSMRALPR